jgi:hypothetical protein
LEKPYFGREIIWTRCEKCSCWIPLDSIYFVLHFW